MDTKYDGRGRQAWLGRATVAVLACLAALAVVYRVQILSGGALLSGDVVDARISVAIEQHWLNVFQGVERWNEPLYLAPATDVLGYNDGYFLYGLVFALLRLLGVDSFLAGEMVGAAFRAAGFAGLLMFGWRLGRLPFGWAVVAATLATISNVAYLEASHIQLLTVGLAPGLAVLASLTLARLRHNAGAQAIAWSCALALFCDMWVMTAFYTAWFTALFGALLAVGAVIARPRVFLAAIRAWRPLRLAPALATLIVGLVPFVAVYWPKAQETGMHPAGLAIGFAPSILDVVHIGSGNLAFGWLDALVTRLARPGFPNLGEHTAGFPPLLLLLAVCGVVVAFKGRDAGRGVWWRPLAIAFVLSLALCLRVGDATLWRLVFDYVPGAAAVRVVARYLLFLDLVAALLAALALATAARHWPWPTVLLATTALLAEEVTTDGLISLDRPAERRMVAAVPPPPPACTMFYVSNPRTIRSGGEVVYQPYSVNVDAMVLAELLHIRTPNGHASFLPPGFAMGFVDVAQYRAASTASILDNALESGLCGLDLQANRWIAHPIGLAPLGSEEVSFAAGGGAPYLLQGWSAPEPLGRWTDGPVARLGVMVEQPDRDYVLQLQASAFAGAPSPVDVAVNGRTVAHWQPVAAAQALSAAIPGSLIQRDGGLHIRLSVLAPTSPHDVGAGDDRRKLGLFVQRLRLTPAP